MNKYPKPIIELKKNDSLNTTCYACFGLSRLSIKIGCATDEKHSNSNVISLCNICLYKLNDVIERGRNDD